MLRMHGSFREVDENPFGLGYAIVDPSTPDRVAEDAAPCAEPDRTETGVRAQVEELVRRAEAGEFEVLYLILPAASRATVEHLVDRLSDTTVSVTAMPPLPCFRSNRSFSSSCRLPSSASLAFS